MILYNGDITGAKDLALKLLEVKEGALVKVTHAEMDLLNEHHVKFIGDCNEKN